MTDVGFIIGCLIILVGLMNATGSSLSISLGVSYTQFEQLIKLWHKVKHESGNYYQPAQRNQDSGQVRDDDSPGSFKSDHWVE